jgi:hypothetical protein
MKRRLLLLAVLLLATTTVQADRHPASGGSDLLLYRTQLSISQVTSLNSSPVTLIAGIPGKVIVPHRTLLVRNGAPKYKTAPGNIVLRCVISSPFTWVTHTSTAVLTSASAGAFLSAQGTASGGASDAATELGGKALDIFSLVGNPTVDGTDPGSPISVWVWYRVYAVTP